MKPWKRPKIKITAIPFVSKIDSCIDEDGDVLLEQRLGLENNKMVFKRSEAIKLAKFWLETYGLHNPNDPFDEWSEIN